MAKKVEKIKGEKSENTDKPIPYADYEWVEVVDNVLTIGISEDGLDDMADIRRAELPEEGSSVDAEEVFGELETEDGPVHLYAPVKGTIIEVNAAVIESAEIITEDPTGEGWLVRIEADSKEEVADFLELHAKGRGVEESDEDVDVDDEDFDLDEDEEDEEEEENY
jgi:glycine cleavage system H protein